MFDSISVTLDSLIILSVIFVDVAEVVVGIAVARVNLSSLLIPLDRLLNLISRLTHDGQVVVRAVILRIKFHALLIGPLSFRVLLHIVIGDGLFGHYIVDL